MPHAQASSRLVVHSNGCFCTRAPAMAGCCAAYCPQITQMVSCLRFLRGTSVNPRNGAVLASKVRVRRSQKAGSRHLWVAILRLPRYGQAVSSSCAIHNRWRQLVQFVLGTSRRPYRPECISHNTWRAATVGSYRLSVATAGLHLTGCAMRHNYSFQRTRCAHR